MTKVTRHVYITVKGREVIRGIRVLPDDIENLDRLLGDLDTLLEGTEVELTVTEDGSSPVGFTTWKALDDAHYKLTRRAPKWGSIDVAMAWIDGYIELK